MTTRLRTGTRDDLDGIARVWAAATAARDGVGEAAPLNLARERIWITMRADPFILVVAVAGPTIVAFGLATPAANARDMAELAFFGVDPEHWSRGIGARLLAEVATRLAEAGYAAAQLHVYASNRRAIRLYERLGWRPTRRTIVHPRSSRPMIRYELLLGPPTAAERHELGLPQ